MDVKTMTSKPRSKVNASNIAAGMVNSTYSRLMSFTGVLVTFRGRNPNPIRAKLNRAAAFTPRIVTKLRYPNLATVEINEHQVTGTKY